MEHRDKAGPLSGLRVVETATGIAGPYAGRLLAMLGATVVKVEPEGGDPARRLPVDGLPCASPSPVFVHLNVGKRLLSHDGLAVADGLRWADVVLSDRVRAEFGPWELRPDPAARPLLVSVTAWGVHAGSPGTPADELLVQAASGLLSATEHDDGGPHRFPGWQTQYLAGVYAAVAALAGAGAGHLETTWLAAGTAAVEAQASAALYAATSLRADDPAEQHRQAGFQSRTFPSGVFGCADGYVVPGTVRGEDWHRQCLIYDRADLLRDARFVWSRRWANRALLRAELRDWYRRRTRREIFERGLRAGWSVGMVLTGTDALTDRHLRARGFLGPVSGAATGRVIVRPWRAPEVAEPEQVRLAHAGEHDTWFVPDHPRPATPAVPDATGLRVLELTWAWAGPLAGRLLGGLGADVVRVETGRYPDGWRTRLRFADTGAALPAGAAGEDYTWDAAAQFNSVNRNKRAVSVDLATPDGQRVFCDLVDRADVLLVNMNHRVLADRGVEQHVLGRVAHGLVLVSLPALGTTGPHRALPGFGMINEAMGGFAARYGSPTTGAEVSPTYYPDAVAGAHAGLAVLAALAGRSVTGRGSVVDLSQQETLWLQLGEGIVLASREGRDPQRVGNTEPAAAASGVVPAADGHVAFVAGSAGLLAGPPALRAWAAQRSTDDVVAALRRAGVRAAAVRSVRERYERGTLGDAELLAHPVAGRRAYLGLPLVRDGQALPSTRPAPCYDQHTDEVLQHWLGTSRAELTRLRAVEAIGTTPRRPGSPGRAQRGQDHSPGGRDSEHPASSRVNGTGDITSTRSPTRTSINP